jgi:ribose transport system ATP-binding protein
MREPTPRVQFNGVSKHYPGVTALDGVGFSVAPACIHALVGENGAGKSTLVKILAGAVRADQGVIRLDGNAVEIRSARAASAMGIAVVHQELNLAADLSAGENVFLGRWPRGPLGLISSRKLNQQSRDVFEALGVRISARSQVGELSLAQRQMVEIARALSLKARVLVLDEPSAVLMPQEMQALFAIIRRLATQGVSVIYISHRLDEVFELCKAVTVLRDGRHISTRPTDQTTRDTLIREMVGRPIAEEFPQRQAALGEVVLQAEGLSARGRFHDVSFEVQSGEVFALTGLVGAGRSSVGRALFGALPGIRGGLRVGRTRGPFQSPREAQRAGIAYLPEDRRLQGLLLERPVNENMSLAHLRDISTAGVLRKRIERHRVQQAMREFQIKAAGPEVLAGTLSGGNQQKVMIARWLQKPYRVVILDEPTRGVDVGAKVEIYTIINRMASAGAAVLLITSELPEAIGMADRIAVMANGALAGVLDNRIRAVTQEMILELAIANYVPRAASAVNGTQPR